MEFLNRQMFLRTLPPINSPHDIPVGQSARIILQEDPRQNPSKSFPTRNPGHILTFRDGDEEVERKGVARESECSRLSFLFFSRSHAPLKVC